MIRLLCMLLLSAVVEGSSHHRLTSDVTVHTPIDYFGGRDHDSYVKWYDENGDTYTGNLFLEAVDDTSAVVEGNSSTYNGVAVHWRVDAGNELLYLAFAARAYNGWVAFGMAEAGGMSGADLVIYETSKPNTLTDGYVLREFEPLIDDCQDWQFISAQNNDDGFLIVEGMRKFVTNDTQDRIVFDDTEQFVVAQKIIAAWSNEIDTMIYHGPTNRVRGALRWFGIEDEVTSFQNQMAIEATGYFDLSFGNYSIKTNDTEYVSFCFDWSTDVVPQGLPEMGNVAMIAIDIVAEKKSLPFLHHISFFASQNEHNTSRVCDNVLPSTEDYLYGWTFGSAPFRLPSDVGFVIGPGETSGYRGFRCEVHYNNPNMIDGMKDNSKLRIYYSTTLRQHEVGVALMADYAVELRGQPINAGISKYTFDCDSQCSFLVLDEPVTVLAEAFHMHSTGSAGLHYQYRNGEVIRQGVVDYFDFDQSGLHAIRQRPFQILPGDSFSTTCIYDVTTPTAFGKESVEEMCFFVILYYPAKKILGQRQWACGLGIPLPTCNATFASDQFTISDAQSLSPIEMDTFYERTFGSQSTDQCSSKTTQPPLTFTSSASVRLREPGVLMCLLCTITLWRSYVLLG